MGGVLVCMRAAQRLQVAGAAFISALALASAAQATNLKPLSAADTARYAAAFAAASQGDFIDAQMNAAELNDRSLEGYLAYDQLMHPSAHKASFDELSGWLRRFRDLPLAERVFGLALRRKPVQALDPPAPAVAGLPPQARPAAATAPVSDRARRAREAFFAGDLKRAQALAMVAQDRWTAGMAAYRLAAYGQAHSAFHDLSRDAGEDAWARSAAAFWASRAAAALGDAGLALEELRLAATAPQTFYGMIAARQLRAQAPSSDAAKLVSANYVQPASATELVSSDPRAHRAAALAQLGRLPAALQELRAGFTLARDTVERERWASLALALGAPMTAAEPILAGVADDYPTPVLEPKGGFTLDRALVYAVVRQESRFNPQAVSGKGAVGLMQLTPEAAARAAGDDKLKADMAPLFDPAFNLRVGQDYLAWLMDRAVGYDLVRAVAAYNGGPGMVLRAAELLGAQAADPLLLMECLPPAETRAYVQKVLAGYWTYKAMFGEEAPSLDALARGERMIDVRLDLAQPARASTQLSGDLLQPALR